MSLTATFRNNVKTLSSFGHIGKHETTNVSNPNKKIFRWKQADNQRDLKNFMNETTWDFENVALERRWGSRNEYEKHHAEKRATNDDEVFKKFLTTNFTVVKSAFRFQEMPKRAPFLPSTTTTYDETKFGRRRKLNGATTDVEPTGANKVGRKKFASGG